MNHYLSRFLTMVVASALFATPLTVSAAEVNSSTETTLSATTASMPDNDTLFAGYLQQLMYPEQSVSVYGTSAREGLNTIGKHLYDALKAKLCNIANGTQESTEIEVDISEFTRNFSVAELDPDLSGETIIYDQDNPNEETLALITRLQGVAIEKTDWNINATANSAFLALLYDCPYECYWFDKTLGVSFGVSCSVSFLSNKSLQSIQPKSCIWKFSVAKAYQPSGYNANTPKVDTAKTGAAATAVGYAKSIVKKNENLGDYEKLKAYRDAICDLVEYNHDAVKSDYTGGYGDPWQIIYVFDQDPNTNVVCEGYAKAFQYLCDLSRFNDDIRCYIVTGTMQGATGAGGHMWNIVTMEDGKNYLADITNSDTGTVGQNGGLFLAGIGGSVTGGYTFMSDTHNAVSFIYDSDNIWDSSVLTLAESNYTPNNSQYAKVTSGFHDSIAVQKSYNSQSKQLVLKIRSKGNTPLPQHLTGYLAVYQSEGLQSVTLIPAVAEDSATTLTVDMSKLSDDAKYSVMIWTDTLAPLIQPINDVTK